MYVEPIIDFSLVLYFQDSKLRINSTGLDWFYVEAQVKSTPMGTRSWSVVLGDTLNFLQFAAKSETASPWSVARFGAASPSRSQSSDLPRQQRIIRRASLGCRPQLAEEEGMCTRARHVRDRFLQVCVCDGFDRSIDLLVSFSTGIFCWIRLRWTGRTVRARTT
jgi:hypothetical protein